ncbi:MAG: type I secretion system permease/ATPase [Hyphomonadaceae bacterium]
MGDLARSAVQWPPFSDNSERESAVSQPVNSSELVPAAMSGLRRHLTLIVLFSAAINLLYLAPSIYMMQVYDRVLPSNSLLTLILISSVLVAAFFVMAQLDSLRGRLLARMSLRVERLGARAIMEEAFAAKRQNSASSAPTPGIRELDTVRQALSSPAAVGVLDLPWTPLFILVCFMLHIWIGVLAIAGAAVIAGLAYLNDRASRQALQNMSARTAQFYAAHDGDLNAAETLRALGAERAMLQRRLRMRENVTESQINSAFTGADFSALTKVTRMLLQSAALGLGAYLAMERMISPGAIIASSILTARAFAPVEAIVGGWRQLAMGRTAYNALRQMFAQAAPRPQRTPLPDPKGAVKVEAINAGPQGAPTLTLYGVSFAAGPGEIIGIIGPSGAGKTTLARVLANASPPRAGAIRIDGARYADWEPQELAKHIGYLPQRVDLFDGTVADNISCFAREQGQTMEEVGPKVVAAAQQAGAHELILALPNGYETQLGPNGAGISPGQAQRIALARSLYGAPVVIVLDEPNAHLDSDGEAALVTALQTARARGATCFVVAHRAGVLGIVDKILVLNKGQLSEYGPRDQVLAALRAQQQPQPQPGQPQQLRPTPIQGAR